LQRHRLRWYGHVLRKDDSQWVTKCVEFVVEGARPRGRPKRSWKEEPVVEEDMNVNKEDALVHNKQRRLNRFTEGDTDDSGG